MNNKIVSEIVADGKKIETTISYSYKGTTILYNVTIDEEGTDDWHVYNPCQGWVNTWNQGYYSGWSYQEADKNKDADYERILVDALTNPENYMDIEENVYDSYDGEEWEIQLETNTDNGSLYEVTEVPSMINVTMEVTFEIVGDE